MSGKRGLFYLEELRRYSIRIAIGRKLQKSYNYTLLNLKILR